LSFYLKGSRKTHSAKIVRLLLDKANRNEFKGALLAAATKSWFQSTPGTYLHWVSNSIIETAPENYPLGDIMLTAFSNLQMFSTLIAITGVDPNSLVDPLKSFLETDGRGFARNSLKGPEFRARLLAVLSLCFIMTNAKKPLYDLIASFDDFLETRKKGDQHSENLRCLISEPKSLKNICRPSIRNVIRNNCKERYERSFAMFRPAIQSLSLPKSVQDFLLFEDPKHLHYLTSSFTFFSNELPD